MTYPQIIHALSIATTVALPSLGVGLGQALIGKGVLKALDQQPSSAGLINSQFLISVVVTETAAILGTIIGLLLLFTHHNYPIAAIGMALSVAIPGFVIGLCSAFPSCAALQATARQPFMHRKITNLLLITLSILQTPLVFGFIMSLIIRNQLPNILQVSSSIVLCASGCALALGSIGPTIGLTYFGLASCKTLGRYPSSYQQILTFTFISQAMIETPTLFAFVIALTMAFMPNPPSIFVCIAVACSVGLSTLGVGIASGKTAGTTCQEIGKHPEHYSLLLRTSALGQAIIDTGAIYGLIISFILLFA
ncbi:MAG: ATP synthase F0 subunit C [Candidatus Babeliaceae bacterium]|jgi:F0F1-type ATP synthase membrane subunit c/vacuolar-type H+-ATPase subunit K